MTETGGTVGGARVTIASLRADAANAKAQNTRLREQLRSLEQRLSVTLGRELASEIDPTGYEPPDQLRAQLDAAHARAFELEEALADAREELDAAYGTVSPSTAKPTADAATIVIVSTITSACAREYWSYPIPSACAHS